MNAKQPAPTRRICPLCRNAYTEPPALSRTDSKTPICPDCGSRQALQALGVPEMEIQQILRVMHQHKSLSAENWSVRRSPKKRLDILSKLCYNKLEKKSCSGNTVTQKESPSEMRPLRAFALSKRIRQFGCCVGLTSCSAICRAYIK